MNERVNQLLDQAKLTAVQEMFEPELYKFAELIVRECAGVAEVSMPINSYPDDRLKVKNSVLEHFGVEE